MQPLRKLRESLQVLADREHSLFGVSDLAAVVPGCRQLPVLLSRAVKAGILRRICKGIFLYPVQGYPLENLLFHTAARLRAGEFNYISLETVLSDAGVISQVPLQWITVRSSGRSHIVDCGEYGNIEFIHTERRAEELAGELSYDAARHLWLASVRLALRDMKVARRGMDLVDQEAARELV